MKLILKAAFVALALSACGGSDKGAESQVAVKSGATCKSPATYNSKTQKWCYYTGKWGYAFGTSGQLVCKYGMIQTCYSKPKAW